MIHVVWRASVSVRHLKTRAACIYATNAYIQANTGTRMSVSAPTAGETNILLVSLSLPILTDMKGAACAGYHGNRCTLHLMGVAVGIRCRIVFPKPWLDAIASFNGMLSILLSLPSSLKTPYSLCGVTTLSCQNSPFLQDGSKAWQQCLLQ